MSRNASSMGSKWHREVNANCLCIISIDFHSTGTIRDAITREGDTRAKSDTLVPRGGGHSTLHSLHSGPVHLRVAEDAPTEIPPPETPLQDLLARQKQIEFVHR